MKKYLTPALVLFSAIVILFSCQRETNNEPERPVEPEKDIQVISSFQGRVLDENGEPVQNAAVAAGGKTTVTDIYGVFRIADAQVSRMFGYISVVKEGYFPGSRSVLSKPDGSNFVEIQLLKKEVKGNINTSSGGNVAVGAGAEVSFASDAFVTASGTPYSGSVKVYGAWLNPDAENFSSIMPGDLRGIRTNNEVVSMISYGMIAVELEGAGGEKLQLAEGKKSTITLPIPLSLQSKTPDRIPLWYFDEKDGKWKEEGEAAKNGNTYTGEVSHFTFWNVDVPANFVHLNMELQDQEGRPLPYTKVSITDNQNDSKGIVFTDSIGRARTWVPKNAVLTLDAINICGNILATKTAGPYNDEASLGKWNITLPENGSITISGRVTDCNNSLVTKGVASILMQGLYYSADIKDGAFVSTITRCSSNIQDITLYVTDLSTEKESAVYYFQSGGGEYDAGTLIACGNEFSNFVNYSIGDQSYQLKSPPDLLSQQLSDNRTDIHFSTNTPMGTSFNAVAIHLSDTIPAVYRGISLELYSRGARYYSIDSLTVDLVRYDQKGNYIEMNFESTVRKRDSSNVILPFKGNMRIIRQ